MFSDNQKAVGVIISIFWGTLILLMSVATVVFIGKSCNSDNYSPKSDPISVYSGEIKFVQLSSDEINALQSDSSAYIPIKEYVQKIEALENQILKMQTDIKNRQDEIVLDIRQETNNNLDKESAWLAFWITVLTIVGVICPLGYQILNFQTEKNKLAKLEKDTENLKKTNEELLEAFKIKFNILSFSTLAEIKIEEPEAGNLRILLKNSIQNHYNQFVNGISELSGDLTEKKEHICSVLINIYGFLDKLKSRSNFEQGRHIRDLKDIILHLLKSIDEKNDIDEIKKDLIKIKYKLTNI